MRNTTTDITHKNFLQFALSAMASLPSSLKKTAIVLEDDGASKEVTSTTSIEVKSLNEITSGGADSSNSSDVSSSSSSGGYYPGGYEMLEMMGFIHDSPRDSPGKAAADKAASGVLKEMRQSIEKSEVVGYGSSGASGVSMHKVGEEWEERHGVKMEWCGGNDCGDGFLKSRLIMHMTCTLAGKGLCECQLFHNHELATQSGQFPGHYLFAPSRFLNSAMNDEVYKTCRLHNRFPCHQWQVGFFIPNLGYVIFAHVEFAGNVQLFLKAFHGLTSKLSLEQSAHVMSFYMADNVDEFKKTNLYMNVDTHLFLEKMRAFFGKELPALMKSAECVDQRLYWKEKICHDEYSGGFLYLCVEEANKNKFLEFPNGEIIITKCETPAATELLYTEPPSIGPFFDKPKLMPPRSPSPFPSPSSSQRPLSAPPAVAAAVALPALGDGQIRDRPA